jgi:hypothetical protein
MRSKSAVAVVCAGLLSALLPQPAGAISDGVPDVGHPNVGALLLEFDPDGQPGVFDVSCSGALISPRHFLTAAHCLSFLQLEGYTAESLAVTFDQDALAAPTKLAVSGYAVHPETSRRRSDPYDVGYGYVPNRRGRVLLRRLGGAEAVRTRAGSAVEPRGGHHDGQRPMVPRHEQESAARRPGCARVPGRLRPRALAIERRQP